MSQKMGLSLAFVISASLLGATEASAQTQFEYKWLASYEKSNVLQPRIAPPEGFKRTRCAEHSFCHWLRNLPLKPEGSPVHYFNGDIKHHAQHYAVLDLDTGKRDLQQCADAVMRLKAEYHYARKDYANIHFNYTSGHKVSFDDWRRGKKPIVRGNKVSFTAVGNDMDNSYRNFRKYMTQIFSYAGTYSLAKEMDAVRVKDIQVGDVFIVGGMPGHAVMVMDVVEDDRGKKKFLLAQSYMPAQDMHILINPEDDQRGPWYSTDFMAFLNTPEWQFSFKDLKRFKN